jgi:hypothetical protein
MFDLMQIGRWIMIAGISLAVVGGLVYVLGKFGGFTDLPGTLRLQGNGLTCVFPILGSIVLSIVLTVVLNLFARLLK